METASKYNPSDVEAKWYGYWIEHKLFASKPDGREPYTIVIPPPNVTGVLHMGHMLNNTIQDILVRRARLMGKNACWVPGTDHASISTEAKVVAKLAKEGIKKTDLSREEFLKHAWAWTEEHGGIILKQLRRLGASCDWDRTAFTMDDVRSESVIKVFCDLYDKGLIYRGVRMVNWDPKALTALSDEEVIYKEEHGKLYYLRYKIAGEDGYAVVATTRPETIMGDTAMCINPNDPKNAHLKGKRVIVPLVNREIPVIEDEYVDIEFGTGCLKVTPAHDINDYMLGQKHNLPSIDIFNDNGTISEAAGMYVGMDRFDVREQIAKDLETAGLLEKTEDYTNKVGFSERTDVVIEPKLSMQWFVKTADLARPALDAVMSGKLNFYPSKYKNTYRYWMENIKDWCISRQLWWGHRIPAYYLPDGRFVVAENADAALDKARKLSGNENLQGSDLRQDPDCLDTWFSSWLWPISLFDGIRNPDNEEIKYYYPTNDLVTGPDIIFFWVARMIMAGYEFMGDMPFRNVYFTGIVRDKIGRKMSKSLGNSPDPIELIDRYGADGVRMGLMLAAPAGNDLQFDEALCEQGRNFNNKIWNAMRLVKGWTVEDKEQSGAAAVAVEWFDSMLSSAVEEMNDLFSKYRISDALLTVYKLFWDEFSSWYLELVKPEYGSSIDRETYECTIAFFEKLCVLLHPFMPFISEEVWHNLKERGENQSIMTASWPEAGKTDNALLKAFDQVKMLTSAIRTIRVQKNIPNKESLVLHPESETHDAKFNPALEKMCKLQPISSSEGKGGSMSVMAGTEKYTLFIGDAVNSEEEIRKAEDEIKYLEGFLASVMKKLSNEKFVQNAKPEVVENERKKKADAESKIATLRAGISELKGGN